MHGSSGVLARLDELPLDLKVIQQLREVVLKIKRERERRYSRRMEL